LLLEGTIFPDLDPFETLAMKFSTLWYSNDMRKKWQSNVIFHTYYNQLKAAIRSEPHITLKTLQSFQPLINFSMNHHFIYLTPRADEHQEQIHSYYKMTEEYLEEITKEWSVDLLVSADPTEMSDIDSPGTAQDTLGPSKTKKAKTTKKTEEVQDVDSLFVRMTSITLDEEGDDEEGTETKQ
jgi:hypothetical protein